ncbi:MAG: LysR family transcriptional regulator [Caldimonas sp.]
MFSNPLEVLLALADAGTLSAAGRRLGITQPGVSKALRRLEAQFGSALVERDARGVRFTVYGTAVLAHARHIDASLRHASDEVRQLRGQREGTVSMALAHAATALLLPHLMSRFHLDWPEVSLRIAAGVFPGLLAALRDGTIDLAVVPLPKAPLPPDFESQPLLLTRLIVVAREGHPLARARRLAELAQAQWILPSLDSSTARSLRDAYAEHRLGKPLCSTTCETLTGMQAVLAATDLLGVMPDEMQAVRRFVPPGLVVLPLLDALPGHFLHLVTRRGAQFTPAIRRVIGIVTDHAQALASRRRSRASN